jgi:hypothetical protein
VLLGQCVDREPLHSTLDSFLLSYRAEVSENLNTAVYSVQKFGRRYEFESDQTHVSAVLIVLSRGTKLATTSAVKGQLVRPTMKPPA